MKLASSFVLSRLAVVAFSGGGLALACGEAPSAVTAASSESALVAEPARYTGSSLQVQQLALTFDDGPSAMTGELSTYLKSHNIRATFFVNGARIQTTSLPTALQPVANATAILQQLAADGHLVANHTTTHRNLIDLSEADRLAEIAETNALITAHGGTTWNRSLFRPPVNTWNAAVHTTLQTAWSNYVGPIHSDIGLIKNQYPKAADDSACFGGGLAKEDGTLIHGDPKDPLPDGFATTDECAQAYLYEIAAKGKGIVLLREGFSWSSGASGGNTVDLVKRLVPALASTGFTFVRADEIPSVAADLPACAGECYACAGPGDDQCTGCAPGSVLVEGKCTGCGVCPAGTFTEKACTATKGATCATCPPSTYSTEGADACTSCAACDDGDPCTEDICSAQMPCAHQAIAGCNASPDGAEPPAAAAPAADVSGCSISPHVGVARVRSSSLAAFAFGLLGGAVTLRRRGGQRRRATGKAR